MSIRVNKFIAQATGLSRRAADLAIEEGRVRINNSVAKLGDNVNQNDKLSLDNKILDWPSSTFTTIMLNKPVGYVCSRNGQGNQTIYDLLPIHYMKLKPVGRLDKDSSGLLVLTDDGELAYTLSHPKFVKVKQYDVLLDKNLSLEHKQRISLKGVALFDGISKLGLTALEGNHWLIAMSEGRNRQIRRTFESLGYRVVDLHRISFGDYKLGNLKPGEYKQV
jgi:pseudouridine synthase